MTAAGLFFFKDSLAAFVVWFETQVGPTITFLPGETASFWWRCAALVLILLALGSWIIGTQAIAGRRPLQLFHLSPHAPFANISFEYRPNFSRQDLWLLIAAMAVACALIGAGDGTVVAHYLIITALLTVAWIIWIRLPLAGSETAICLGLDQLELCDAQNICTSKPGGLAEYPLGLALAYGRWLWPTFALAGVVAPAMLGAAAVINSYDISSQSPDIVKLPIPVTGVWISVMLARRVSIGTWMIPGRMWSEPLFPLGDFLLACLITIIAYDFILLLSSILSMNQTLGIFAIVYVWFCCVLPIVFVIACKAKKPILGRTFGSILIANTLGVLSQAIVFAFAAIQANRAI